MEEWIEQREEKEMQKGGVTIIVTPPTAVIVPYYLKPWDSRLFLWQRMKDSNPHKQSQSLVCYHYTNPLYGSFSLERP